MLQNSTPSGAHALRARAGRGIRIVALREASSIAIGITMTRTLLPGALGSLALFAVADNQLSAMPGVHDGAIVRVHLVDREAGKSVGGNAIGQAPQRALLLPVPDQILQAANVDEVVLHERVHPAAANGHGQPSPEWRCSGTLVNSEGAPQGISPTVGLLLSEGQFELDWGRLVRLEAAPGLLGTAQLTRVGVAKVGSQGSAIASGADLTHAKHAYVDAATRISAPRIDYQSLAFDHHEGNDSVTWSGQEKPEGEETILSPVRVGAVQMTSQPPELPGLAGSVGRRADTDLTAARRGSLFADRLMDWSNAGRIAAIPVLTSTYKRGNAFGLALGQKNWHMTTQIPVMSDRNDPASEFPKAIEKNGQDRTNSEIHENRELIDVADVSHFDRIEISAHSQVDHDRLSVRPPVYEQGEAVLVQLGALVELLSIHFEPQELARIRASHARYNYVPLDKLQTSDIPVTYDTLSQHLKINLVAAQAGLGEAAGSVDGIGGGSAIKRTLVATASAGLDNNPFLSPNGNAEAASLRLQLAPSLSYADTRNTVRLGGRVEHIEYLGRYGSLQNYGADLSGRHRINERLQANAGLLFKSDNLATNLANPFFQNDDLLADQPVPAIGNDVTLLGQQQRRTQYGADGGLRYTLSERDELQWATSFRADRFGNGGLAESDFLSQQLRYSRQLNSGTTVGAIVNASIINFSDPALGDARTITPQLLVTTSLSPRLEASGSVGVAFTRIGQGDNATSDTALSGNLSLCYQGELSGLCLTGARQVLPSGIGGARLQTTGGITYSLRMSERETLQLGGNYSTASQPLSGLDRGDFESINGFVRYERRLDERMRIFVSGGFLETSGNFAGNASNVQGLVGIVADFGNAR